MCLTDFLSAFSAEKSLSGFNGRTAERTEFVGVTGCFLIRQFVVLVQPAAYQRYFDSEYAGNKNEYSDYYKEYSEDPYRERHHIVVRRNGICRNSPEYSEQDDEQ